MEAIYPSQVKYWVDYGNQEWEYSRKFVFADIRWSQQFKWHRHLVGFEGLETIFIILFE